MSEHSNEDRYFHRIEHELTEKLRNKLAAESRRSTATERKELHWNRCGKCGGEMKPKLHRGVEIDLCPDCGAVLLDPGELEELAGEDESSFYEAMASLISSK